jgi:outer membrane biosynthesis protein TonB
MKLISIFSLGLVTFGLGQKLSAQNTSVPDKQNMQVTTQDAFYPKGEQALYTYIMYNTKYSPESIKNYVTGNVELSFDVMPDSTIKNAKIISDVGYEVGDAVKKLVEQLKFAPAIMMGTKVKSNLIMDFPVKAH